MRASSSRVRRHFAQFDDELQDSDQTISTPARHLRPRARLPTVTDASSSSGGSVRARFPTSAFFSDTTDDDTSRPVTRPSGRSQLSVSAYSYPTQTRSTREPLHMSAGPREDRKHTPRLHIEAIQFPATRSVLWDRRRLSETSIGVSLGQVLPHFVLSAGVLKEIYRLYNDESGVSCSEAPLCYLYGDATSPRVRKVLLDGVTVKKETRTGMWCIPVHTVADGKDPGLSQESYFSTIRAVQSSYRDEYSDSVASKIQPKLLVFRSSLHTAQLGFQLECAASPVLFKFNLVRNLPLLMTPLAASLAKREFSARSGNLRSGYLTLDRTRKAVPLLKVDPLVLQQPLIGVWVYGVQIDDAWDEEIARRQLADPFLYFACIGYLMSNTVKERVGPKKNTFLVALYPANDQDSGGTVSSLPRFFECSFSEFLSPQSRPLPMELYSDRRSCLVGVSKFSSDVELHLSAAPTSEWEAARRQANIPTAPRSEDEDRASAEIQELAENNSQEISRGSQNDAFSVLSEEGHNMTSGWTVTVDAIPKGSIDKDSQRKVPAREKEEISVAEDSPIETETKPEIPLGDEDLHDDSCADGVEEISKFSPPNESKEFVQRGWTGNNTSNHRSCCKTQQLLTIQHQQILENQQKQLHEMQEQITQLRRLLHAARTGSNNKKQAYASPNDDGYDSDASSSSAGAVADVSNVSSTFSRHGNGLVSSQSSMVSGLQRSGDDPVSDTSSVYTHEEKEGANHDEEVADKAEEDNSLSSLGLSSISSGSDADLSSLSSSLMGGQLKKRDIFRSDTTEVQDAVPEAEGLSLAQVSQLAEDDLKASELAISEASAGVEAVGHEHELADESSNPHNLSIGELSASSTEEVIKDANKVDLNFASDKKDDDADVDSLAVERLLPPDAYLRKVGGFVDHHGGCFTAPPLDFHSFCVPRIKFSTETPECSVSDSEDEEIRLIEQKYTRLMAA
ncbi:SCL-interrupting locus [Phytophthora citrophthora]|uniref:SCL-interrupting locus n=1 Tax=Phytophthora citrophthora TaxID=4793 RepID=A0AAD9GVN5_9STRA|nr:SCL-interrupting locus [Phytophthora citrophthora]